MIHTLENGKKVFWAGQAKTGEWVYCLNSIKEDINKSIINYYFADSIAIMCDIMRGVNSLSEGLTKIVNDINDIVFDCNGDREKKTYKIIDYFITEGIYVRIPCLIMPGESKYKDEEEILQNIKNKIHSAFSGFNVINPDGLNVEVLLLVFPIIL